MSSDNPTLHKGSKTSFQLSYQPTPVLTNTPSIPPASFLSGSFLPTSPIKPISSQQTTAITPQVLSSSLSPTSSLSPKHIDSNQSLSYNPNNINQNNENSNNNTSNNFLNNHPKHQLSFADSTVIYNNTSSFNNNSYNNYDNLSSGFTNNNNSLPPTITTTIPNQNTANGGILRSRSIFSRRNTTFMPSKNSRHPKSFTQSDFSLDALPLTSLQAPVTAMLADVHYLYIGSADGLLRMFPWSFSDTPRSVPIHNNCYDLDRDVGSKYVQSPLHSIDTSFLSSQHMNNDMCCSRTSSSSQLHHTQPLTPQSLLPPPPTSSSPPSSSSSSVSSSATTTPASQLPLNQKFVGPTIPLPSVWRLEAPHTVDITPYHRTVAASPSQIQHALDVVPSAAPLNYESRTSPLYELPSAIQSIELCPQNHWIMVLCNNIVNIYNAYNLTFIDTVRPFPQAIMLSDTLLTHEQRSNPVSLSSSPTPIFIERFTAGNWQLSNSKSHSKHVKNISNKQILKHAEMQSSLSNTLARHVSSRTGAGGIIGPGNISGNSAAAINTNGGIYHHNHVLGTNRHTIGGNICGNKPSQRLFNDINLKPSNVPPSAAASPAIMVSMNKALPRLALNSSVMFSRLSVAKVTLLQYVAFHRAQKIKLFKMYQELIDGSVLDDFFKQYNVDVNQSIGLIVQHHEPKSKPIETSTQTTSDSILSPTASSSSPSSPSSSSSVLLPGTTTTATTTVTINPAITPSFPSPAQTPLVSPTPSPSSSPSAQSPGNILDPMHFPTDCCDATLPITNLQSSSSSSSLLSSSSVSSISSASSSMSTSSPPISTSSVLSQLSQLMKIVDSNVSPQLLVHAQTVLALLHTLKKTITASSTVHMHPRLATLMKLAALSVDPCIYLEYTNGRTIPVIASHMDKFQHDLADESLDPSHFAHRRQNTESATSTENNTNNTADSEVKANSTNPSNGFNSHIEQLKSLQFTHYWHDGTVHIAVLGKNPRRLYFYEAVPGGGLNTDGIIKQQQHQQHQQQLLSPPSSPQSPSHSAISPSSPTSTASPSDSNAIPATGYIGTQQNDLSLLASSSSTLYQNDTANGLPEVPVDIPTPLKEISSGFKQHLDDIYSRTPQQQRAEALEAVYDKQSSTKQYVIKRIIWKLRAVCALNSFDIHNMRFLSPYFLCFVVKDNSFLLNINERTARSIPDLCFSSIVSSKAHLIEPNLLNVPKPMSPSVSKNSTSGPELSSGGTTSVSPGVANNDVPEKSNASSKLHRKVLLPLSSNSHGVDCLITTQYKLQHQDISTTNTMIAAALEQISKDKTDLSLPLLLTDKQLSINPSAYLFSAPPPPQHTTSHSQTEQPQLSLNDTNNHSLLPLLTTNSPNLIYCGSVLLPYRLLSPSFHNVYGHWEHGPSGSTSLTYASINFPTDHSALNTLPQTFFPHVIPIVSYYSQPLWSIHDHNNNSIVTTAFNVTNNTYDNVNSPNDQQSLGVESIEHVFDDHHDNITTNYNHISSLPRPVLATHLTQQQQQSQQPQQPQQSIFSYQPQHQVIQRQFMPQHSPSLQSIAKSHVMMSNVVASNYNHHQQPLPYNALSLASSSSSILSSSHSTSTSTSTSSSTTTTAASTSTITTTTTTTTATTTITRGVETEDVTSTISPSIDSNLTLLKPYSQPSVVSFPFNMLQQRVSYVFGHCTHSAPFSEEFLPIQPPLLSHLLSTTKNTGSSLTSLSHISKSSTLFPFLPPSTQIGSKARVILPTHNISNPSKVYIPLYTVNFSLGNAYVNTLQYYQQHHQGSLLETLQLSSSLSNSTYLGKSSTNKSDDGSNNSNNTNNNPNNQELKSTTPLVSNSIALQPTNDILNSQLPSSQIQNDIPTPVSSQTTPAPPMIQSSRSNFLPVTSPFLFQNNIIPAVYSQNERMLLRFFGREHPNDFNPILDHLDNDEDIPMSKPNSLENIFDTLFTSTNSDDNVAILRPPPSQLPLEMLIMFSMQHHKPVSLNSINYSLIPNHIYNALLKELPLKRYTPAVRTEPASPSAAAAVETASKAIRLYQTSYPFFTQTACTLPVPEQQAAIIQLPQDTDLINTPLSSPMVMKQSDVISPNIPFSTLQNASINSGNSDIFDKFSLGSNGSVGLSTGFSNIPSSYLEQQQQQQQNQQQQSLNNIFRRSSIGVLDPATIQSLMSTKDGSGSHNDNSSEKDDLQSINDSFLSPNVVVTTTNTSSTSGNDISTNNAAVTKNPDETSPLSVLSGFLEALPNATQNGLQPPTVHVIRPGELVVCINRYAFVLTDQAQDCSNSASVWSPIDYTSVADVNIGIKQDIVPVTTSIEHSPSITPRQNPSLSIASLSLHQQSHKQHPLQKHQNQQQQQQIHNSTSSIDSPSTTTTKILFDNTNNNNTSIPLTCEHFWTEDSVRDDKNVTVPNNTIIADHDDNRTNNEDLSQNSMVPVRSNLREALQAMNSDNRFSSSINTTKKFRTQNLQKALLLQNNADNNNETTTPTATQSSQQQKPRGVGLCPDCLIKYKNLQQQQEQQPSVYPDVIPNLSLQQQSSSHHDREQTLPENAADIDLYSISSQSMQLPVSPPKVVNIPSSINTPLSVHPHVIPILPSIQHNGNSFINVHCSQPLTLPVNALRFSVISQLQYYALANWNELNAAIHHSMNQQHQDDLGYYHLFDTSHSTEMNDNNNSNSSHNNACDHKKSTSSTTPTSDLTPPPLSTPHALLPYIPPSLAHSLIQSSRISPLLTSPTATYFFISGLQESHLLRLDRSKRQLPLPVYIPSSVMLNRTEHVISSVSLPFTHTKYELPSHVMTLPVYATALLHSRHQQTLIAQLQHQMNIGQYPVPSTSDLGCSSHDFPKEPPLIHLQPFYETTIESDTSCSDDDLMCDDDIDDEQYYQNQSNIGLQYSNQKNSALLNSHSISSKKQQQLYPSLSTSKSKQSTTSSPSVTSSPKPKSSTRQSLYQLFHRKSSKSKKLDAELSTNGDNENNNDNKNNYSKNVNNSTGMAFVAKSPIAISSPSVLQGDCSPTNETVAAAVLMNNKSKTRGFHLHRMIQQITFSILHYQSQSTTAAAATTAVTTPTAQFSTPTVHQQQHSPPQPPQQNVQSQEQLSFQLAQPLRKRLVTRLQTCSQTMVTFLLHVPCTYDYQIQYMQKIPFSFFPPFDAIHRLDFPSITTTNDDLIYHHLHPSDKSSPSTPIKTKNSSSVSTQAPVSPSTSVAGSSTAPLSPHNEQSQVSYDKTRIAQLQLDRRSVQLHLVQNITSVHFGSSPFFPIFSHRGHVWMFQPTSSQYNDTTRFLSNLSTYTSWKNVLQDIKAWLYKYLFDGNTLLGRNLQLFCNYLCKTYGFHFHKYSFHISHQLQQISEEIDESYNEELKKTFLQLNNEVFSNMEDAPSQQQLLAKWRCGQRTNLNSDSQVAISDNYDGQNSSLQKTIFFIDGRCVIPPKAYTQNPLQRTYENVVLPRLSHDVNSYVEKLRDAICLKCGFDFDLYPDLRDLTVSVIRETIFTLSQHCLMPLFTIKAGHQDVILQRVCDLFHVAQPFHFGMSRYEFHPDKDDAFFDEMIHRMQQEHARVELLSLRSISSTSTSPPMTSYMTAALGSNTSSSMLPIIEQPEEAANNNNNNNNKSGDSQVLSTTKINSKKNKSVSLCSSSLGTNPSANAAAAAAFNHLTSSTNSYSPVHALTINLANVPRRVDPQLLSNAELSYFTPAIRTLRQAAASSSHIQLKEGVLSVVGSLGSVSQIAERIFKHRANKIQSWRNFKEKTRHTMEWQQASILLKLSIIQARKRFGLHHPYSAMEPYPNLHIIHNDDSSNNSTINNNIDINNDIMYNKHNNNNTLIPKQQNLTSSSLSISLSSSSASMLSSESFVTANPLTDHTSVSSSAYTDLSQHKSPKSAETERNTDSLPLVTATVTNTELTLPTDTDIDTDTLSPAKLITSMSYSRTLQQSPTNALNSSLNQFNTALPLPKQYSQQQKQRLQIQNQQSQQLSSFIRSPSNIFHQAFHERTYPGNIKDNYQNMNDNYFSSISYSQSISNPRFQTNKNHGKYQYCHCFDLRTLPPLWYELLNAVNEEFDALILHIVSSNESWEFPPCTCGQSITNLHNIDTNKNDIETNLTPSSQELHDDKQNIHSSSLNTEQSSLSPKQLSPLTASTNASTTETKTTHLSPKQKIELEASSISLQLTNQSNMSLCIDEGLPIPSELPLNELTQYNPLSGWYRQKIYIHSQLSNLHPSVIKLPPSSYKDLPTALQLSNDDLLPLISYCFLQSNSYTVWHLQHTSLHSRLNFRISPMQAKLMLISQNFISTQKKLLSGLLLLYSLVTTSVTGVSNNQESQQNQQESSIDSYNNLDNSHNVSTNHHFLSLISSKQQSSPQQGLSLWQTSKNNCHNNNNNVLSLSVFEQFNSRIGIILQQWTMILQYTIQNLPGEILSNMLYFTQYQQQQHQRQLGFGSVTYLVDVICYRLAHMLVYIIHENDKNIDLLITSTKEPLMLNETASVADSLLSSSSSLILPHKNTTTTNSTQQYDLQYQFDQVATKYQVIIVQIAAIFREMILPASFQPLSIAKIEFTRLAYCLHQNDSSGISFFLLNVLASLLAMTLDLPIPDQYIRLQRRQQRLRLIQALIYRTTAQQQQQQAQQAQQQVQQSQQLQKNSHIRDSLVFPRSLPPAQLQELQRQGILSETAAAALFASMYDNDTPSSSSSSSSDCDNDDCFSDDEVKKAKNQVLEHHERGRESFSGVSDFKTSALQKSPLNNNKTTNTSPTLGNKNNKNTTHKKKHKHSHDYRQRVKSISARHQQKTDHIAGASLFSRPFVFDDYFIE